jgi:SAM-dependent methyltransferase
MTLNAFPPEYFFRADETNDGIFYTVPRLVVHIDDHAILALRLVLKERLPPGGVYLDLMSSWRSHLPDDLKPERVVGLGMNAQEMAENPQLQKYVVHDLNLDPTIPFEDNVFDAVTCTVSVQYMIRPIEVFQEVNRVLKPGGVFILSFSNRCFPNKAVSVWLSTTDRQHVALVTQYFEASGNWRAINSTSKLAAPPQQGDPLYAVWGMKMDEGT